MTHSIDAPLPPPATMGTGSPPRRTDHAPRMSPKDEAKNVQADRCAGRQPGRLHRDRPGQGSRPGDPAPGQGPARPGPLPGQEQAISQQQKAGQSLTSLAQELRGLADGTSSGAPGPARDLLQQASGMVDDFAHKLQNREPAELLDDVRSFARRKPGLFLLGAAAAGVARRSADQRCAGRPQRLGSVTAANGYRASNYVDPTPVATRDTPPAPTRARAPATRPPAPPRCRRRRTAPCRPRAASSRPPPRPAGTTRPPSRVGWADP